MYIIVHHTYIKYLFSIPIVSFIFRNKSVENLLLSSHDVLSSINSSSLGALNPNKSGNEYSGEELNDSTSSKNDNERNRPISPNSSPQSSPKIHNRKEYWKTSGSSASNLSLKEHDNWSKADDQSLVCLLY